MVDSKRSLGVSCYLDPKSPPLVFIHCISLNCRNANVCALLSCKRRNSFSVLKRTGSIVSLKTLPIKVGSDCPS